MLACRPALPHRPAPASPPRPPPAPPHDSLINFKHRFILQKHDDAFTFTMKNVLRFICHQQNVTHNPKCSHPLGHEV